MKTTTQNTAYYLQVVFLALVIGIGLQIASAWTPPNSAPPTQSVTAPITTSVTNQTKLGGLSLGGNITATAGQFNLVSFVANTVPGAGCTLNGSIRYTGSDFEGCLSGTWTSLTITGSGGSGGAGVLDLYNGLHSSTQCTSNGGVVTLDGVNKYCRFNTLPAPAGWTAYQNWSATGARTCTGVANTSESVAGSCGVRTCSIVGHAWQNTAVESCTYVSGGVFVHQGFGMGYCTGVATLTCSNKTQGGFY